MTQVPHLSNEELLSRIMRGRARDLAPSEPSARGGLGRVLPGSVLVAAALVLPGFSVGAGDLDAGEGRSEPPEPAAKPGQGLVKTRLSASGAARLSPTEQVLSGVRYAPIVDLGTGPARAVSAPKPRVLTARSARGVLPEQTLAAPALAAPLEAPTLPVAAPVPPATAYVPQLSTPLASPAGRAPEMAAPASLPQDTAAPLATPAAGPAPAPLAGDAPSALASAPSGAADDAALAAFVPEEKAALRAPAGMAAPLAETVTPPAPSSPIAAPAPVAAAAATPVAARVAPALSAPPSAGRGAIEQLTPARIAAARSAPTAAAPAATPAPSAPVAAKPAPLAAKPAAAAAAPGARAPVTAPASTPAPPTAAAVVVPKPAPALTAPPAASAPTAVAAPDFKAQLLTRIGGKTAGTVEFRQSPAGLTVRLGSVAEVLADRIAPAELDRIRNSEAGNAWLSLAELQARGVPISYDPVYDEFNIGNTDTRPKAGRKVHMDQISVPERGAGAAVIPQARR
ncbi:hypothetical protein [Erythrobacter colymbi]|uniref:hypothetical protein n=1 Tax=Erythrobacter colymbi TaxID=1161202 RepID=UPI000A3726D5|nr:hypothetical protein [Erythrobacter colymbi]